jgi:arsenite methyltransferase
MLHAQQGHRAADDHLLPLSVAKNLELTMTTDLDVKQVVKSKYGEAAMRVAQGATSSCCGGAPASLSGCDPITSNLYDALQADEVPEKAMLASLGCGNPTALAELKPGETVLDLGSGGGIDVLLSARRVGPTGLAFGLDMTDEMLALADENKRKSGLTNVHFLKGEIEHIPLPDHSVDVVISNCVINLSGDKDRVLKEAFRVLKPGGRFAVSDVVVRGEVPESIRRNMELWVGCVAGALSDRDYLAKLATAGFEQADIEVTRVYTVDDAREFLSAQGADLQQLAREVDGKFVSAFIRAVKPAADRTVQATPAAATQPVAVAACCAPRCCS